MLPGKGYQSSSNLHPGLQLAIFTSVCRGISYSFTVKVYKHERQTFVKVRSFLLAISSWLNINLGQVSNQSPLSSGSRIIFPHYISKERKLLRWFNFPFMECQRTSHTFSTMMVYAYSKHAVTYIPSYIYTHTHQHIYTHTHTLTRSHLSQSFFLNGSHTLKICKHYSPILGT